MGNHVRGNSFLHICHSFRFSKWRPLDGNKSLWSLNILLGSGLTSCCPVAHGGFGSGQSRDRPLRRYSAHAYFHPVQRKPMQIANLYGSLQDRANIERCAAGFNCHGSLSFQGWFIHRQVMPYWYSLRSVEHWAVTRPTWPLFIDLGSNREHKSLQNYPLNLNHYV